ncbi:MAG: rhomboid family intramembrane serine protease, partial [Rhodomicrobium sp.]|nr:rhomboid family intramembrane serine protease [Rhodomicrobium sp.]
MGQRGSQTFFESPHAVTYVLILLNSAAFGLTLLGNSLAQIDPATLFHYGAIYKDAVTRKEYWRFIAYAFLHANVLHFALNMLCIAAWSGLLEKRLGATYFILVYLASAIGGGVASLYGHPGPFLTVGASGAISGIVGGLLCLTILGKLQLSAQFFVITIGINAALAARVPNVDWMAHLGGFTAGVAACALLDALETLNRYWLRCKFPEFVKFGIATAAFAAVVLFHSRKPLQADIDILASAAAGSAVILLVTKLADLILARPKGLAVLVFAIAAFYGGLLLLVSSAMTDTLPAYCEKAGLLARN